MKPYLAVLYDSFVESVRSRVLWMLLLAWTLLLAALFPLTITSTESYKLGFNSFSSSGSAKQILDMLADASVGKSNKTVLSIYNKLGSDFQQILQQRAKTDRKIPIGMLIEEFNILLSNPDLYQEELWPTAKSRATIKELIDKDSLSENELEKLNRRLLSLAFPSRLNHVDGQETIITWAGLPIGSSFQIPIESVRAIAETLVFPMVMRIGLGGIAMLIAIVITSAMIPDMFQTGSLYLLLSKPISRSLLFLTKFLGGCIFVAINIAYLLVGLYIYAGTRLGTWNEGILWCIPLFLFMFVVYYSVSSLVGLIWKNPIVSVVVTAVFWAVCFGVGFLHFFFKFAIEVRPQITRVLAVNDTVISGTMQGRMQIWDEDENKWQLAYGEVDGRQIKGPVWSPHSKALYYARVSPDVLGFGSNSTPPVEFARLPDLADPSDQTFKSKPWADARLDSGPTLPPSTVQMIPWDQGFAVFNQDGLYAFDVGSAEKQDNSYPAIASMIDSFFKREQKDLPGFQPILNSIDLIPPFDLCTSPSLQHIVVISNGELQIWKNTADAAEQSNASSDDKNRSVSKYEFQGSLPNILEPGTVCLLATNDQVCLICPNGQEVILVDLVNRSVVGKLPGLGITTVKQTQVSSSGSFALLDIDSQVWTVSPDGTQVEKPNLPGQSRASAIYLQSPEKLWVAHTTNQVDLWDLPSKQSVRNIRPNLSWLEKSYHYFINPFYLINPKPSSVSQTIDHVMANPENRMLVTNRNDLDQATIEFDPWQPLWSNALFVLVMLSTCCWYLYRQDL